MSAIHETMEALHEMGAIDKQTMREFDESCLTAGACAGSRGDKGDSLT